MRYDDSYLAAADAFAGQVAAIPTDSLGGPGLGSWDLRSLVGHTSRALVTVDTYLDQPAEAVALPSAASYVVAGTRVATDPSAVAARGVAAGEALGERPADAVGELVDRLRTRLASYDAGYLLTTIGGGMRLDDYLRTRLFELVVHGYDIEQASGVAPAFDGSVVADAVALAGEVVVGLDRGRDLLLALTGRRPLPGDLCVV